METNEKIIIFIGILLISIHGFFQNFIIDWVTVIIFVIIASPTLFNYLEKLNILGTEFTFKRKLELLKEDYKENKENIKPDKKTEEKRERSKNSYETFDFSLAKKNIDVDPNLALASMRIEIEKKLRESYRIILRKKPRYKTIKQLSKEFKEKTIINNFQLSLLLKIIEICNLAVHGVELSKDEAKEILNIADSLNKSFSIGYCINFEKNRDYKKQELLCPYEHCIEFMNLPKKDNEKCCPIFGHECPGKEKQIKECSKKDLEKEMKKILKIKS